MAKAYSFIITSDDGGTPPQMDLVKDKIPGNSLTPTYGDFLVFRDGSHDASIYVSSNLDGNYSFEYTVTGIYEIRIGSGGVGHTVQDELKDIHLIGVDPLSSADVVNTLVSTSTVLPLSAAMGKSLEDDKADDSDLTTHTGGANPHSDSASDTDLTAHEVASNPHSGSASDTPGDGMQDEGSGVMGIAVSTEAAELDLGFNAAKQLQLLKSFSSEVYINENMTFGQLMSVIDNRLRQLTDQGGGAGKFYAFLHSLEYEDSSPSNDSATPVIDVTLAAYKNYLTMSIMKTPEMRQIVVYFTGDADGNTAYVRLSAGGLSQGSGAIVSTDPTPFAIYLDITSLSNWGSHKITIDMKTDSPDFEVTQLSLVVRDDVTALSGETSYEQEHPVE